MKGNKFRLRMKSKKWSKFVYFANIANALNVTNENLDTILSGVPHIRSPAIPQPLPAGHTQAVFNQAARDSWFGPLYAAGGAGPVDALNNPTTVGNGLLWMVSTKDDNMTFNRWDYSSYPITQTEIIAKWNANNNLAGAALQIPATSIFVKGVKVNAQGRNSTMPSLCYLGYKKAGLYKTREQINSIKGYFSTKKETVGVNIGGAAYHWSLPQIDIGSTVFTRIKITVYYKIKNLVY